MSTTTFDYETAKYNGVSRKGSKKVWAYQYHNAEAVMVTDDNSNRSMYIPRARFEKDWKVK